MYNMEIIHYTIERGFGDTKSLHYLNCFTTNDVALEPDFDFMSEEECEEWRRSGEPLVDIIDYNFLFIPASEFAEVVHDDEELSVRETLVTQYITRLPESMARQVNDNYYGKGNPGTYLPIEQVNEDTPCGDYWCNGWWVKD